MVVDGDVSDDGDVVIDVCGELEVNGGGGGRGSSSRGGPRSSGSAVGG